MSPGGQGAAAVLGLMAALAWYFGNRYQRVANDPPRTDFDTIDVYQPPALDLGAATDPFAAAWIDLAKNVASAGVALDKLVLSLERCAGAIQAKDLGHELIQLEAVRYNGYACRELHVAILQATARANLAWYALRPNLFSSAPTASVNIFADVRARYRRAWTQYRRRSRLIWLPALASLTLVGAAAFEGIARGAFMIVGTVAAITVASLAAVQARFLCPRCGQRFFVEGFGLPFRAAKCRHCDLPKWADDA